jgi:hypothetical protein
MRRSLPAIYAILKVIDKQEINGGVIFQDEYFADPDHKDVKEFLPLMERNELVYTITDKLKDKSNEDIVHELTTHHLTWKGHCFLDLYDIWGDVCKKDNLSLNDHSIEKLIAKIAVTSFY